ncbi:glutamine-hydrolyzing carbamoyl-phosphate synthase small subunit [Flavobacterium aurantiibacter]|uniref:Carbamoyl phosphate synthase small chain n=1 Tax=Flavobacterium aurantiibacter TaxID=2023067 RepID=A0A255ZP93_9FLAO|nr:glutamine-hydrolyzing carbamoyl-phosphate synthase small subunit [Flavobacterium aurantiibacter]OYQ43231.1 carbamoyl phosphate synthase small subunit [Flavobacterium aurantiibacter]
MKYQQRDAAILLLADGTIFHGKSIGIPGKATGELCFNTGMTGYQEIFTDPSYFGQLMVTTNAHIGNYGVNRNEKESGSIKIAGLICRNFSFQHSRPDSDGNLFDYFKAQSLIAISDVDTRALTAYIRDHGAQNAIICTDETPVDELKSILKAVPDMKGLELASRVSATEPYFYGNPEAKFRISALDLGIKENILRHLASRDCYIKVFPYNSAFSDLSSFNPHGYFLSNGPGDPEPLTEVIALAKEIISRDLPLFGICLGHQLIGLANDVPTYKMFNGHRGINHPVFNVVTGKGEITSQNHGFAVERAAVEAHSELEITHLHLNDGTIAGMRMKNKPVFSVQYHPEASPGPNDSIYLFDAFVATLDQD